MVKAINFKKNFNSTQFISWTKPLFLAATLLLVLTLFVWWQFVRNDPERTFEAMLNNSLRTSSVTRTIRQQSGLQQLEQTIYFQNQPEPIANSITEIRQTGSVTANVVTESIGLPQTDFVRYVQIQTSQEAEGGGQLDYGDVENIWGKDEVTGESSLAELYGDSALGVIPMANLNQQQRAALLQTIEELNVYDIDYNTVEKFTENGRQYYGYTVGVNPQSYVRMLQEYARYVGLTQLEGLDTDQFSGSPVLTFNIAVDVLTQRLYTLNTAGGERQERFGSYGVVREVEIPEETISVQELQSRVQQVQ
jgi:hypothetical protein